MEFDDGSLTRMLRYEETVAWSWTFRKMSRIVAVSAALAFAFGGLTQVHAGTLPDISGTWHPNGNGAIRAHISQSGTSVSLNNGQGATATGTFVDPSTLRTNWGTFNGGHITGAISNDLRRIDWSNGTYWSRPAVSRSFRTPRRGRSRPTG